MTDNINVEAVNNILNTNLQNKEEICKYCNQKLPCDRKCFEKYLQNICFFCNKKCRDKSDLERHFSKKQSCLILAKQQLQNNGNEEKNIYEKKILELEDIIKSKDLKINKLEKKIEQQKKEIITNTNNEEYLNGRFSVLFNILVEKGKKKKIEITKDDLNYLIERTNNTDYDHQTLTNIQSNVRGDVRKIIVKHIIEEHNKYTKEKNENKIKELSLFKHNLGNSLDNESLKHLANIK